MFRHVGPIVIIAAASTSSLAQTPKRVAWDYHSVPITIEVARDVPVRPCGFERGVLCAAADFIIPRGGRFQMLEVRPEGGCIIRYRESEHEVSSCPWVLGFADPQSQVFVIVEIPRNGG